MEQQEQVNQSSIEYGQTSKGEWYIKSVKYYAPPGVTDVSLISHGAARMASLAAIDLRLKVTGKIASDGE